jgi:N-ethylmaleimide reductase
MAVPHLISSFRLHDLTLKNRVCLAPLTRSRAGEGRTATPITAQYYAQRSSAGLIVTEATFISEQGIGWGNTPSIFNDRQAESWKQVTQAVHEKGSVIFSQLWHCGRSSHSSFRADKSLPVAPSAIKITGAQPHLDDGSKVDFEVPRALETNEIPGIVEDYRRAAARAKAAGFDGIEVHSANGYLLGTYYASSPADIMQINSCNQRRTSAPTNTAALKRIASVSLTKSSPP